MSRPELIHVFDVEDAASGVTCVFEIEKNTHELYFNKKRVVTDVRLSRIERGLAWAVGISTVIIAICNTLSALYMLKIIG